MVDSCGQGARTPIGYSACVMSRELSPLPSVYERSGLESEIQSQANDFRDSVSVSLGVQRYAGVSGGLREISQGLSSASQGLQNAYQGLQRAWRSLVR